ncbi:phosphoglucomutase [Variovorax sp. GrIS 2.14]|jgi:phosphoglucomutase|uniref:phosphoglucomutase (alpha-D-glucose-1,6-bisphosphate-dependent) n=1 Tax=unclassified Variovorax TaxID=663243 RepID=UPI00199071B4|nr:phosphoglucomutase (alpha-D-glucose-1,6-bisphosphate-dependent) [Variovorax sp. RTB1]MBC7393900.1 alpha-D-glucose phosphate-specific phosphoglucomutase [Variovorax sp.]MEB0112320.1 phosphoglucomutase (alpha-D-glucose-1,6-bisphosphate-dependent) [Variovorax sp. RTB1]
MSQNISPLAGQPAPYASLVNVPRLVSAYYSGRPDASVAAQRVAFGTSGHRGSSFDDSFNEWHVLAITQAICDFRKQKGIDGPLFLGIDTHALSTPAFASAVEVLAANGVELMLSKDDEYTPTPAVSHAILVYNRGRKIGPGSGLADGIVVSPSHNPPESGGFKYNPPNGGPAGTDITSAVEAAANAMLANGLAGVKRMPLAQALKASTTHRHDFLNNYVEDLASVIDMDAIRGAEVEMGVDPLGGAGVNYWAAIGARYKLKLTVLNPEVDPRFRFMSLDWDGRIRMDPSSPYAMHSLVEHKERFPIIFACDTDHDRHGIVTRTSGLMQPNSYLAVMVDYLFTHRPHWSASASVGKTLVSSSMIDRVAASVGRKVYEVPVGFKWFVDGLVDGSLGFGGEESAGATFLRRDGAVWTTDKDGLIAALLSGEIKAQTGRDPGERYAELTAALGKPVSDRVDAAATPAQKKRLSTLSPAQITSTQLAGEKVVNVLSNAPGNGAALGGVKVMTENGWFAARPSGTENIYKIYGESFLGEAHLQRILGEAQTVVDQALGD